MTYIILGILIIGGVAYYMTTRNNSDAMYQTKVDPKNNTYNELRNRAFITTPEILGLSLPIDQTIVYGIIMDWEIDSETASTIVYQTGDASLYLSTGGGVIGGGQYQNVNNAAKKFVILAQSFLDRTAKTEMTPLPTKGEVKFYLLTNKGIFVGQEQMINLENNTSALLKLFDEGNKVITELSKTSEK